MVARLINFQPSLYDDAMAKAKRSGVPLAFVVRHLLRLWLKGEIEIVLKNENEN